MAIGQFGPALEAAMKRAGNTRGDVGRIVHTESSMVGKVMKGSRRPSKPVMQAAVQHYGDVQLVLAAAAEVTGGASVPWLDCADLHTSSTHIKTIEEIREAEQALQKVPVTKRLDQLTPGDLKAIKDALMEQIEAITALTHNVAVTCRKYDFSYIELWKEHRQELKIKKYMN
ncbi:XRE family transcriptional regulator [Paenibacillus sp. sgz500958]|uniref:XRE family transcriptional regulator n=1 Tax=Paenibacillus sp. sgz500958 TaxID=3242475 RepID=UPI0036D365F4